MNYLDLLLTHIDRLQSQHKAGVNPPAGDLLTLWDLKQDVREAVANNVIVVRPSLTSSAGAAATPGSPAPAAASSAAPGFTMRLVAEVVEDATGTVQFRQPVKLFADVEGPRA